MDLNPGFATYYAIQNKLFSLSVFPPVKWGSHLPKFSENFCYLEGIQIKPASLVTALQVTVWGLNSKQIPGP